MELETAIAFTDALVFAKAGIHLSDLQQAMLRASWSWQRQSYDQIAEAYGYSATYLKHDVGPKLWKLLSEVLGEKVTKTSFRAAIERQFQAEGAVSSVSSAFHAISAQSDLIQASELTSESVAPTTSITPLKQDWGEAVDVNFFYGRQQELDQLTQWIVTDRCRLVAVLGMGGMGKTALSVKLAQQLVNNLGPQTANLETSQISRQAESQETTQSQRSTLQTLHPTPAFQFIIWRSLRNVPPLPDLLVDLLQTLSHQQESSFPETVEGKLGRLLHYLRSYRCLLVLDNVETVLQGNSDQVSYGHLFRQVGETLHQSCVVITSREKPRDVAVLEGQTLPVRSMQLGGLPVAAGQELFKLKGSFQGTDAEWRQLVEGYSGNPLALKMISTTIQTLFAGEIADFLQQETFVFGTIRNLIEQQFSCLPATEKTVMYWLAINREPIAFAELRTDIFPAISSPALIEVLESLEHRSLVERNAALFSLQPVVMEYVTDLLVEQVCQELQSGLQTQKRLCRSHALLKANAKDYIRDIQAQLILQPILDCLLSESNPSSLVESLYHLLSNLQGKAASDIGYTGGNLLNLLFQIETHIQNRDLSRLVLWQANFQNINLQSVDLSDSDLSNSLFSEILGIVFTVAYSPDGMLLATGDAEGGLRLWQATDGKPLLNLIGHLGWVWSVAFSRDGSTLASCSSDKTIRLWDVNSGQCLQVLRGHTGSVWSVAFSGRATSAEAHQLLASGGDESAVKLWDTHTGECIQTLVGHTGRVLSVTFAAEAHTLATGGEDGSVRLWNLQTGYQAVLQAHTDRVWSVAFSHDDQLLASGSADGTVKLWDVSTGTCLKTLEEHSNRVRAVTFSPDGQTLASASDDQMVRLWNVQTGECLSVLTGHSNTIFSVTFNANGQTVASGSADQTVRFWQVHSGRCLKTVKGYTNSVFSIAFSADGEQIASGSTDQMIRLWNNKAGYTTLRGHEDWVVSVAFQPQGDLLASASADQTVRLWSLSAKKCLKTLRGHANWVQSVAFSPDGTLLASGGDDRTIRLWSVETGQCLNVLQGHRSWVWSVAFSPKGDLLASSSDDQTIRLWSVQTGECLRVLTGHTGQIQTIAFSPTGELLASGSGDETVRLWSVSAGDSLQVLSGHDNNVWSVAFSPDGSQLASGSLDQTVKLWDVQSGTCVRTLAVVNQSVRSSIAFRPVGSKSGNTLATGSHSEIHIWNTATGERLKTLVPDRPYQGTNITGVTGLTEAQKEALKALGAAEL